MALDGFYFTILDLSVLQDEGFRLNDHFRTNVLRLSDSNFVSNGYYQAEVINLLLFLEFCFPHRFVKEITNLLKVSGSFLFI